MGKAKIFNTTVLSKYGYNAKSMDKFDYRITN